MTRPPRPGPDVGVIEPLVDTVVEDERWLVPGLETLATRCAASTLATLGVGVQGLTICVMGCDDGRIAALNTGFRGKPGPTNVLSWPATDHPARPDGASPQTPVPGQSDDPEPLGDIAISYDTCAAEAQAERVSLADHASHLIVHGLLHLLGYDHDRDADAALMEGLEVRILATMGISDPYD